VGASVNGFGVGAGVRFRVRAFVGFGVGLAIGEAVGDNIGEPVGSVLTKLTTMSAPGTRVTFTMLGLKFMYPGGFVSSTV
jgi:hypothetical protein